MFNEFFAYFFLKNLVWMVPINPGNWKCELIISFSSLLFPHQSIRICFTNSFKIRVDETSDKNKIKLKRRIVVIIVTPIASALVWRNTELSNEFWMTDFPIGERTKRHKARLVRTPSDKVRQMEFWKTRISRPRTSTRKTRPPWQFSLFSKSCRNFCRASFPPRNVYLLARSIASVVLNCNEITNGFISFFHSLPCPNT